LCGSEAGCTFDSCCSLTAPSPSAGTCVHVAITRAVAESTSVFLGQTLAPQGQGGWLGWWTHQGEQADPSYLAVAVERKRRCWYVKEVEGEESHKRTHHNLCMIRQLCHICFLFFVVITLLVGEKLCRIIF